MRMSKTRTPITLLLLLLVPTFSQYVEELNELFNNTMILHQGGTSSEHTLECPPSMVIVWGYTYFFSEVPDKLCVELANRSCDVGETSCTVPECNPTGHNANGILIVCGSNTIPGSTSVSLSTSNVASPHSISCSSGNKILFGFKFQFGDMVNNNCFQQNVKQCGVGYQSCFNDPCEQDGAILFMYGLCVPEEYTKPFETGGLMVRDKFKDNSGGVDSLNCTENAGNVLTGLTMATKRNWKNKDYLDTIYEVNNICPYTENEHGAASCTIGNFESGEDDRLGLIAMLCSRDPTPSPTTSPTSTVVPTVPEVTEEPTTSLPLTDPPSEDTNAPTGSPLESTDVPTTSPLESTDVPTTSPLESTDTPTFAPSTYNSTNEPWNNTQIPGSNTPTTSPTSISTSLSPTPSSNKGFHDSKPVTETEADGPGAKLSSPLIISMILAGVIFLSILAIFYFRTKLNTPLSQLETISIPESTEGDDLEMFEPKKVSMGQRIANRISKTPKSTDNPMFDSDSLT